MRPGVLALVALVLAVACGGEARAPAAPAAPSSARVASASPPATPDGLPLAATVTVSGSASTFQGGDDHIQLHVVNQGRRIERFTVSASEWLAEHSFAMGSTRLCDQDPTAQYVVCGPIEPGQSVGFTLRAIPSSVGDFDFTFRPYDEVDGRLLPIPDPTGAPQVLTLREQVVPVTSQIPGYHPDSPAPSPG